MKRTSTIISMAMLASLTGGCVSDDQNLEGISLEGGNAIAHNSALQIIAPWPDNVHDTSIVTPAGDNSMPDPKVPTTEPTAVTDAPVIIKD